MSIWGRRKDIATLTHHEHGRRLKPSLGWPHLLALGVGAIVGTGIYTLTGVGADRAGPAVILSFAIAGAICACAALVYAELSTLMPAAGSAYTYTYTAIGEWVAWIIGWSLILEYTVSCSAVAVGWSAYVVGLIHGLGVDFPHWILVGPYGGGIINLPAVIVSIIIAIALAVGTKESATVNIALVLIKLTALVAFVVLTLPVFNAGNLTPFMPYGFSAHSEGGEERGVMAAAALVFFAFYGFDAVSTSAEEAKNPSRDLLIGIVGSLALCILIYMAVAASAVGAVAFQSFSKSGEPLALILRTLQHPMMSRLVGLAALVALPTVILVMMYGQSRIFFVMSRDGLLPREFAHVHPRFATPALVTLLTGGFVAAIGGFFRLDQIVELANAGTLAAFVSVSVCMLVLRRARPDLKRVFSCPAPWLVGPLAIIGCLYLFISLPPATIERFLAWNAIGLIVYVAYGRVRSRLAVSG